MSATDFRPGGGGVKGKPSDPARSVEHGTWGAVKRHRKAGAALCDACRDFHQTYYRDYARTRRRSAVERSKLAEGQRRWAERNRASRRDYSRRYYRQHLAELRQHVDPIALERVLDIHRPLPALNPAEKRAAFALLLEHRWTVTQAGDRLRLSGSKAKEWAAALTDNPLGATG